MTFVYEISNSTEIREQLRNGFEAKSFAEAANRLGVSNGELARCLGVSPRTINRKCSSGVRLSLPESERVFRVHRVWNAARMLFDDDQAIAYFLRTPDSTLGVSPLELLDTEVGAIEAEGFINGLSYGNFQ